MSISRIESAFLNCFGKGAEGGGYNPNNETNKTDVEENATSTPSQETRELAESTEMGNFYNADAVLTAFRSGDDSSLSAINRSILDAAKDVIASEITDDMNDYEKSLPYMTILPTGRDLTTESLDVPVQTDLQTKAQLPMVC